MLAEQKYLCLSSEHSVTQCSKVAQFQTTGNYYSLDNGFNISAVYIEGSICSLNDSGTTSTITNDNSYNFTSTIIETGSSYHHIRLKTNAADSLANAMLFVAVCLVWLTTYIVDCN